MTAGDPLLADALVWRGQVSPWLMACLVTGLVVWLRVLYKRLAVRLGHRVAALLVLPKAALAALAVFALLEPHWVSEHFAGKQRVAVLLDTSSSMEVADDGRRPRVERARRIAERLKRELEDGELEYLPFDTHMPSKGDGHPRGTDIGAALLKFTTRGETTYDAALLLTDGGDEVLQDVPVPASRLHVLALGTNPEGWNDLSLAGVVTPATVEKDAAFEVALEIAARAGGGGEFAGLLKRVEVVLEELRGTAWAPVSKATVDVSGGGATVRVPMRAEAEGVRRFRARVVPVRGELSELNNERPFTVETKARALRVLYYARELGQNYKAVRAELARDPTVSFTGLLRTGPERYLLQAEGSVGLDALARGFPVSAAELKAFDVVVIDGLDSREWSAAQRSGLLKFVEDGGAVVLLAGDGSIADSTELAGLLPWTQRGTGAPEARGGPWHVAVPVSAASHPAVAGVDEALRRGKASVDACIPTGPLRPGASVLLAATTPTGAMPLVATQRYGRGKVLATASNTLWRWTRQGESLRTAYGLFWRQAVRDLCGRSDGSRALGVRWDREAYRPGEAAVVEVEPLAVVETQTLTFSAGISMNGAAEQPVPVEAIPSRPGVYQVGLRFPERGDYRFRLTAHAGDHVFDRYERAFPVGPLLPEGAKLEGNAEFLRELARRGRGEYAGEESVDAWIAACVRACTKPPTREEFPVTQASPIFFCVALGLLVLEWSLRRRYNLQ